MALMEAVGQGILKPSPLYKSYLETCLLCGACEEICPNEVHTLPLLLKGRAEAAQDLGIRPAKGFILRHLVGAAHFLKLVMKTGWFVQALMFKRVPEDSGVRRRFPMPLISRDRTLPRVANEFFTETFDGMVSEGHGPRVGIFSGCMTNYFYPQVGESMVNLLSMLGATVIVPEDQTCCGMPALTGGAMDTVRSLALRNLEAFERFELDVVVTGCASCGGNLKDNYPRILTEAGVSPERVQAFTSRVRDINEFLVSANLVPHLRREVATQGQEDALPLRVTYHHPCHLGRIQGIRDEPIRLIRSLPGVEYVPMAEADRCCGMGGSFSIEHYDLSKVINDRKVDRIIESGAEAVITSCPACIMHIRDGLRRHGHERVEVMHITELLAWSVRESSRRLQREAEEQQRAAEAHDVALTAASPH